MKGYFQIAQWIINHFDLTTDEARIDDNRVSCPLLKSVKPHLDSLTVIP